METLIAWGVVLGAGLGALLGVFVLTRRIRSVWLRSLLRCLAAVWMMVPWSIQVVEGQYAPAFVVAVFEGVFRAGGNPKPALAVLALATAVVILLVLLAGLIGRRRRRAEG
jgi:hypothetical protein